MVSCQNEAPIIRLNDVVIASVDNRTLYQSELNNVIHPNISKQDSIALAGAYIDKWVRDQLMAREAAKSFSSDIEIETLVDDYREKLLRFNLEEKIIETRFDTTITKSELNDFYESIKEQFQLSEGLYRCIYAKFDPNVAAFKAFSKEWKEDKNDGAVASIAMAYAEEHHLDTLQWVNQTIVDKWHDGWSQSRINRKLNQRQSDGKYEFFLKIVDHMDNGAVSPLEYIRPQLIKMLLHKRKQNIIEEYKQELFEKALNNNNIKLP